MPDPYRGREHQQAGPRPAPLEAAPAIAAGAHAQGIYPGDAVRVNGETISYQRFNGYYVEYRNSKGVAVGARGDQLGLLTRLRGRKGGQDAQLFFDPDLPDPAAEPDVDYVIDAKGRLSGGRRKLAIGLDWQPRQPEKPLTAQAREGVLEGMAVPRYAAVFADGSQVVAGRPGDA